MSSKAKKFEGKNDDEQKKNIIEFLESVSSKLGIKRDDLAVKLGVSNSAFYGWIYRREIPSRTYDKLLSMLNGTYMEAFDDKSDGGIINLKSVNLAQISLDDLIAEIEKRNWTVKIERKNS